jgi:Tol biopolymer transport system component
MKHTASAILLLMNLVAVRDGRAQKGVMLMNRIGPTSSELFVANADGSNEHPLLSASRFDYHASWSANGQWIAFTSERNGLGQADIFRVRPDGTGLEQLTDNPSLDDQPALSPDARTLAFVSTRNTRRANIWILDIATKKLTPLTTMSGIQGDTTKPDAFLRPSWSPDGKWIAFSSDRNTAWLGHGHGSGWEHVQELGVYIVRPNGHGLRRVSKPGIAAGSPKWSADAKRLVFYEIPVEQTWDARLRAGIGPGATSQIVSIDVATGERREETSGPGLKVQPQYVGGRNIGYLIKGGTGAGLAYTGQGTAFKRAIRDPSWTADGSLVVYEKVDFKPLAQNVALFSWDPNYEYRYTDVFPTVANDGKLVVTEKAVSDGAISIMDADGSNKQRIFTAGSGAAFAPAWSPDGQWIAFGLGGYLQARKTKPATIMVVRRDGTGGRELTPDSLNAGFPSWSPDGKRIVYRLWGGATEGLRIINVADGTVQVLTNEYDNLPFWSPDGSLIAFTRKHEDNNFDIYTIRPDGTGLRQLTTSPANDAHAVWTADSKYLMWNSGVYGFKDEAALYDNTFQPYGGIFIMNADGSNKRQLTDSPWEDGMPRIVSLPKGR